MHAYMYIFSASHVHVQFAAAAAAVVERKGDDVALCYVVTTVCTTTPRRRRRVRAVYFVRLRQKDAHIFFL